MSNEQNVYAYYNVKPSNKRFIIPHYKKILLFWLFFSRKSVEIPSALCICPSVSARVNDAKHRKPVKCLCPYSLCG